MDAEEHEEEEGDEEQSGAEEEREDEQEDRESGSGEMGFSSKFIVFICCEYLSNVLSAYTTCPHQVIITCFK